MGQLFPLDTHTQFIIDSELFKTNVFDPSGQAFLTWINRDPKNSAKLAMLIHGFPGFLDFYPLTLTISN